MCILTSVIHITSNRQIKLHIKNHHFMNGGILMSYILKTLELSKHYNNVFAVNSVNINIKKGEIYGLVGRNGAGKTTIMKMIAGLTIPSRGSFELFDSKDLNQQRGKIGCIIETPALYDNMTAEQNLDIMMSILPENPQFNVNSTLNIVGLQEVKNKKVRKFSLGMKQRLGIALSLLGSPEFLILDEPINGLDPIGIKDLRELILKLNQNFGLTILISSHILGELFKLASSYGIISNGKLVAELHSEDIERLSLKIENMEEYIIGLMEAR